MVLGIPSSGGTLGWARSSPGLAQPPNGAARAPAQEEGLAVGWGGLLLRLGSPGCSWLGNGAGCGNGPDPATHKLTSPSRCGSYPPFSSAPQPLVGFPCQGPGCKAWGSSAPPHQPGAGGGGMCCSWAEAADAALLEITLLHARRQREKLLSRALSAQPALSARRGGRGGPALPSSRTQPPPHRHPWPPRDKQHHFLAQGSRGCCQRVCGFRGCSAAAVVGCPCCPTVCMGQPSYALTPSP